MERYELEKRYEDDDEIDLAELLKAIVRERKIVAVITVLFTVLSLGFVFYKSTLPKVYTAEFLLKNNSKNFIFNEKSSILPEQLEIYNEKINLFIKLDEIKTYILTNNILTLGNGNTIYTIKGQTDSKTLLEEEKEIKTKLNLLNKEIDELVIKNINKKILNHKEEFSNLSLETKNINEQLIDIIKTYNLNLSEDKVYENLLLIDPVLYTEFKENENRLSALYSDLKTLNSLSKNHKEIINLEFKEIKFENQKLNNSLIVIIGIIFGLFAGMFTAIIKEPLKNILKEIKSEK